MELCVVCVGQKRHAPPPLLAALAFSPLLAASGRHSMGDDSPWSSVSPPGLPTTVFLISFLLSRFWNIYNYQKNNSLKWKSCDIYEDVDIFEHVGLLKTNPLDNIMFCDLCNVCGTHLSFALQIGPRLASQGYFQRHFHLVPSVYLQ